MLQERMNEEKIRDHSFLSISFDFGCYDKHGTDTKNIIDSVWVGVDCGLKERVKESFLTIKST